MTVPTPAADALRFVYDYATIGGNGEGWTFEMVLAVVTLALGEPHDDRDLMLARNVMGQPWLAALAVVPAVRERDDQAGEAAYICQDGKARLEYGHWCDDHARHAITHPATDGEPRDDQAGRCSGILSGGSLRTSAVSLCGRTDRHAAHDLPATKAAEVWWCADCDRIPRRAHHHLADETGVEWVHLGSPLRCSECRAADGEPRQDEATAVACLTCSARIGLPCVEVASDRGYLTGSHVSRRVQARHVAAPARPPVIPAGEGAWSNARRLYPDTAFNGDESDLALVRAAFVKGWASHAAGFGPLVPVTPAGDAETLRAAVRQLRETADPVLAALRDWLTTAAADLWAHGPLHCAGGCDCCDDEMWMPHARRALETARAVLAAAPVAERVDSAIVSDPPHLAHEWSCLSKDERDDVLLWAIRSSFRGQPRQHPAAERAEDGEPR